MQTRRKHRDVTDLPSYALRVVSALGQAVSLEGVITRDHSPSLPRLETLTIQLMLQAIPNSSEEPDGLPVDRRRAAW
jgi:hypothetical protein